MNAASPNEAASTAIYKTTMDSPVGTLTLIASEQGLRAVLFENASDRFDAVHMLDETNPILDDAIVQLGEYFAGGRTEFDLPLELEGTEFQVQAWRSLSTIPFGVTASYAEQAARIGRPKAVRAVGAANGQNPVSIVLPCHRVVGSTGNLTGYGGGLGRKEQLLRLEGALPSALFE